MLKYNTERNQKEIALNGASISTRDFIFTDNTNLKTPLQFGVDGVYAGVETFAGDSPFAFKPNNKGLLGGSNNSEFPNGLTVGSHTVSIRDRYNNVVETATFTVGA